jgi:chlorobactene glucosyltransferase
LYISLSQLATVFCEHNICALASLPYIIYLEAIIKTSKEVSAMIMNKRSWWQCWSRLFLWSHVVGVIGFYLLIWWRIWPNKKDRVHPLPPASTIIPSHHPFVSVIVPARNEERNIRRCVTSLLEQDYDNYEVIVVDDGSTDRTGQILDDLAVWHPQSDRLYVLRLRDSLPAGWAGKPHAIHKGTREVRGTWLLLPDRGKGRSLHHRFNTGIARVLG